MSDSGIENVPESGKFLDNRRRKGVFGLRIAAPISRRRRPRYLVNIMLMVALCFVAVFVVKGIKPIDPVYIIKVDGNVIGATEDKETLFEISSRFCEAEAARVGAEVHLCNEITLETAGKDSDVPFISEDDLAELFRDTLTFTATGYVIAINGNDVVALSCEEEARGVVSDLRGSYVEAIASGGDVTVEEVFIREDVGIEEKQVPSSAFRRRDEAVRILNRGTDRIMDYTVQRGDSIWSIAQANELTVPDLLKANPEVGDGELIHEGQNINLVVPEPYVTLESTETVTYGISIPYTMEVSYDPDMWPWKETVIQWGQNGQKEVTQEITRENGRETSRVTLKERIISYPVTYKLIRGSKQVPAMGTGQMAWPVQGTITSYYGWRWGAFHHGIDIGADIGTPIIAADAGMIRFAAWNGGYGYLVRIDHGGGKETWYGHLSGFAVDVGDTVAKGDVIGYVGSTGVSTGPHLHFEVRFDGDSENPLNFYD